MASTTLFLFHLLVISSHVIILSNAVPFTRSERLMRVNHQHQEINTNTNTHLVATEESLQEESVVERVDLQVNDYPGSGANNRHTPRSQYGRCVDC